MRHLTLAVAFLALAPSAQADEARWRLVLEGGSELDTNPRRIEGKGDAVSAEPAGALRLGGRWSLDWRPTRRRALSINAVAAGKKFLGAAEDEDVAVLSAEAQVAARMAEAPLVVTGHLSYYDAIERDTFETRMVGGEVVTVNTDRDFRTGAVGGALSLVPEGRDRVTANLGLRFFEYKPDSRFDFDGEFAGLAYGHTFGGKEHGGVIGTRTDLAVQYGISRRRYDAPAFDNVCTDGGDPADPTCRPATGLRRTDLFHSGAVEVVVTGERIASVRYELHWNHSNSFGESLLRHRLEVSGTSELVWNVVGTLRAVVQFNEFLDPLLLEGDVGTFLTVEDENRNALIVHLTRDLSRSWTAEARYAFYSNEFATEELRFRRQTVYLGLVYAFSGR